MADTGAQRTWSESDSVADLCDWAAATGGIAAQAEKAKSILVDTNCMRTISLLRQGVKTADDLEKYGLPVLIREKIVSVLFPANVASTSDAESVGDVEMPDVSGPETATLKRPRSKSTAGAAEDSPSSASKAARRDESSFSSLIVHIISRYKIR